MIKGGETDTRRVEFWANYEN